MLVMDEPTRFGLVVDENAGRGARVKARREKLGMKVKPLADAAGVDRGRLGLFEEGAVEPTDTWIRRVEGALDRLEHEMWLDDDTDDLVEFTIEGNFGVRAAVKGPIRDIDKLREAAAQFARELRGSADET